MSAEDIGYSGYSNRATWNVVVLLSNDDEDLYKDVLGQTAQFIKEVFINMYPFESSDEVNWLEVAASLRDDSAMAAENARDTDRAAAKEAEYHDTNKY